MNTAKKSKSGTRKRKLNSLRKGGGVRSRNGSGLDTPTEPTTKLKRVSIGLSDDDPFCLPNHLLILARLYQWEKWTVDYCNLPSASDRITW
jgi:hypothetical protein